MTTPGAASQRHVDRLAGNLLRMARARTGVSQAQLAELAGVPRSTVERIEAGTRQPSLPTLAKLLAAVDLELRVRLEPYDDHDDVLQAHRAALSAADGDIADARHDALVDAFRAPGAHPA